MPALSRDLLQRLYAAPPDGFVAARDAAVAAARAAGDPAGAREIAKLRKPTVAAWLVNLLAIRRPDLIAELVELSAALRAAQRELRGPTLRELSGRRRAVVGALVAQARTLAGEVESAPPAGKLPLGEVETTLNAALSDMDIAEQVRSGQLVRAVTYAGFGEVPRPRLRLVTSGVDEESEPGGAAGAPDREAEPTDQAAAEPDRAAAEPDRATRAAERAAAAERARRRRELHRELARARTDQERAEKELSRSRAAERDATDALAEVTAELAALERKRAAAEQEAGRRKLARKGAERSLTLARRRAGEVEAAVESIDREGAAGSGGSGADSGG